MGVKGRDLALYLFFLSAAAAITEGLAGFPKARLFSLVAIFAFAAALYYFPYFLLARKFSRRLGLKCVVLLPLNCGWARLLLFAAGKKIRSRIRRAFEIHIEALPGLTLGEFLKMLDADLNLAKNKLPGSLFIWETSAPVPASIRNLIKEKSREGNAFWEKGGWPFPRFPFTGRNLKKSRLRRGAILVEEKGDVS